MIRRDIQLQLLSITVGMSAMSCFMMNLRPQMNVKGYSGEGTVSQIRSAESPGFKIDFASFSLASPHEARYRLDGLPERHAAIQYEAGIVVDLTVEEASLYPPQPASLMSGEQGTVVMVLEDATGATLFRGEARIEKLYWQAPGDLPLGHTVEWYYHQGKEAHPLNQPWFLTLEYSPGADSADRIGHVRFIGGGWH